jgi:predicted tellurium resistance membrane protein TerC
VGAVLLAWIACKLIQEEAESADHTKPAPVTLPKAIIRIAMADFIMSLDNIVAIAGASNSDPVRIVLGLLLSISILLFMSALIMEIMNRYRWIAWAGAAVLALTAANMMVEDVDIWYQTSWKPDLGSHLPSWSAWAIRIIVMAICLTTHWWWPKPRIKLPDQSAESGSRSLESVLD